MLFIYMVTHCRKILNMICEERMKTRQIEDSETLFTRKQAADFLKCKPNTLAEWKCTKRYSLPCVKIGKNVRYKLSDLLKFIENNMHK